MYWKLAITETNIIYCSRETAALSVAVRCREVSRGARSTYNSNTATSSPAAMFERPFRKTAERERKSCASNTSAPFETACKSSTGFVNAITAKNVKTRHVPALSCRPRLVRVVETAKI